jgi:hypothetical protein
MGSMKKWLLLFASLQLTEALRGKRALVAGVPDQYVIVPGGYMHRSCVRRAHVSAAGLPIKALHPCSHPFIRGGVVGGAHGSAWKAWAQVGAPTGDASVTSLNSTWVVPGPPISPGDQTLFFWNGVEPADTSAVLQPVLQWGSSAAGGGPYWAYASWYVSATHGSHFSPLVKVAPGDSVVGTNTLGSDGATWSITAVSPGKKPSTVRAPSFPVPAQAPLFHPNPTTAPPPPSSAQLSTGPGRVAHRVPRAGGVRRRLRVRPLPRRWGG